MMSLILAPTLVLAACSSDSTSSEETEKIALHVEVETVQKASLDAITSLTGTLMPTKESSVSFELGGIVKSISVDIGDSVKEGEVLASLSDQTYSLQLKQAETAVSAAKASISAAEARIASAQASLSALEKGARGQERVQAKNALDKAKAAYEKLKTDTERMKALLNEGLISQKEYEDMELQLKSAEKDYSNAQQSYSMLEEGATAEQRAQGKAGVAEAKTGIEQAQSAYEQAMVGKEQAELTLAKTILKAPFSGVILSKNIVEGQQASPGIGVFTIGQTQELKVLLPVPDREVSKWKVGDTVNVELYDEKRVGKVTKIFPQTNASTGTVSIEVVIPNDDLTWIPGQIVKANRISTDNMGILIPIEAVLSEGLDPYVFVVEDGKAVKTSVKTGNVIDNKIHIIEGLNEGEKVVIRGGELLLDGDPVEVGEGD